ncbi:MAG: cytochrome D1 domain-containing protein [Acidobacteriota bacterium]|nr:cytochrome D1 domain-containing protein [Acidobacteriota bacterium]
MKPHRTMFRSIFSLSLGVSLLGVGLAGAQTPSPARLLVLLRDASALAIVDPASGNELGRVPTGRDPHEVTASDDGRLAFVASMVDGISVIDLQTQEEIDRVDPGPGSRTHDVLFADGKVYFTIEGYKSIGRYDPRTNQIDWTLGIGQDGTHLLVLDDETDTLFAPNVGSNTVTMVENFMAGPAQASLTVIPVPGERPEGIDLSPDGRELWTATRNDGDVSIIDVASRQVVQTLDLGMRDANRLKFTPDGRVLVIDGEAASLLVLDAASRAEITRVSLGPTDTGDGAVLVGADGARAYLGLRAANRVAVLDLNTLEITQEIEMGDGTGPGCLYWVNATE